MFGYFWKRVDWTWVRLVLSSVGLFVALYLSLHAAGLVPAICRAGEGCLQVLRSRWSAVLGLPVAFWGLGAYLVLFVANARLAVGGRCEPCRLASYFLSGAGTLASFLLTLYSVNTLRTTCPWCLASAVTWCLLLLAHGMEGVWGEVEPQARRTWRQPVALLAGVGLLLVWASDPLHLWGADLEIERRIASMSPEDVMGRQRPMVGDKDSGRTVVVVGELSCLACREALGRLFTWRDSGAGIRIVFRHGLLDLGRQDVDMAVHLESAHRSGMLESWLRRVIAERDLDAIRSLNLLQEMGIPLDASLESVVKEETAWARRLGIRHSPVLVLIEPGHPPMVAGLSEIESRIASRQPSAQ